MKDCNARDYIPNWRVKADAAEIRVLAKPPEKHVPSAEPKQLPALMQSVRAKKRKAPNVSLEDVSTTATLSPALVPAEEKSKEREIPDLQPSMIRPFGEIDIDDLLSDL